MVDIKELASEIFAFDMFDMYSEVDIIRVLKAADDAYYNESDSFINDTQYDALRLYASKSYPSNVYFTGVGSDVRGGKVKLPYQMGSLDQVEIGEIEEWISKWELDQQHLITTDKLDGTSALVLYDDDGYLQIAYSRGNGIEGADITRHIKYLVPRNIGHAAVIRGEVIIPKDHFDSIRKVAVSRSGATYKNARNMVAGLMNAKTNHPAVYNHIHFVAYEILNYNGVDKVGMLTDLSDWRFKTPTWYSFVGSDLNDTMLADHLNDRRAKTNYEIDGVVIDVNSSAKRNQMNPTKDTLNPAYSVKYKVADASNYAEAKVVDIEINPSKHGYLKPTIIIEPTELVGVTITRCTGFNMKFIRDNKIQPGCIIKVTRAGDVIPMCLGVNKPGPLV